MSADLARSDDLRVVLKRCTDALVKHVEASFARIWTVDAAENFLELLASSGIYTRLDGPHGRVKMGQFKIGRIAENRQPHLTNDVQNDPNISDPDWARREGMVAFAGYPLLVEGQVVGVIALFARQPFTEELLKELSLMADGLAQWIQRKQAE
ncbi:MAG: GAF domain-containing protein [Verrucomicrobiota bacterium]